MSTPPIEGMTRAALDTAESKDFSLGKGPLRPRDAATLILVDRRADDFCVLMGRRHARHAFMPGKFVFPGGRTDPADGRVAALADLPEGDYDRIAGHGARASRYRARAIALSALRETYEEAGLLVGRTGDFVARQEGWQGFAHHKVQPALDGLRLIARAITPPGRVRRYDTRFLSAWRDDVSVTLPEGGPTNELEELVWLPIASAKALDLPQITRSVLTDLEARLSEDPRLTPGWPVPFYRMERGRFVRHMI